MKTGGRATRCVFMGHLPHAAHTFSSCPAHSTRAPPSSAHPEPPPAQTSPHAAGTATGTTHLPLPYTPPASIATLLPCGLCSTSHPHTVRPPPPTVPPLTPIRDGPSPYSPGTGRDVGCDSSKKEPGRGRRTQAQRANRPTEFLARASARQRALTVAGAGHLQRAGKRGGRRPHGARLGVGSQVTLTR